MILISSERFADHQTPPGHPESPARAAAMLRVADQWRAKGGEVVAPRMATVEQLERVHDARYVKTVLATEGRAVAFDADTYTSPESCEIALLAAGAAIDSVEQALGHSGRPILAMVRPPGHHAEVGRAMGFCLFNNVAVGAAHARASGAGRVAIVDFDVHHGNGTQHMFDADPSVLYVSMHQHPYYPGTGTSDEVGSGEGRGFTVNVPLEVGAVDDDYALVFRNVVNPIVRKFSPDLLLVSAGFDAHQRDPLAGMRVTTEGFAAMTMELKALAGECCDGRVAFVTEGGYDLTALTDSLRAVVDVLASPTTSVRWPEPTTIGSSRGRAAVEQAKAALVAFWDLTLES